MQIPELTSKGVDSATFCEARNQVQNAAHWLARMAESFVAPQNQPDARALFWTSDAQTISTPEIAPGTVLTLRLPELWLQFAEGGALVPHRLEVEGKSSAEIEAWLRVEMLHRDFDRDKFSTKLPYHWAKLMSGDEKKYSPDALGKEIQVLTGQFRDASLILFKVRNQLQAWLDGSANCKTARANADDARLQCWPQGLDIGFKFTRVGELANASRSIKVAFMAGDGRNEKPRFFVSPESPLDRSTLFKDILSGAEGAESGVIVGGIVDQLVARARGQMAL